jgi:hypothetical protein
MTNIQTARYKSNLVRVLYLLDLVDLSDLPLSNYIRVEIAAPSKPRPKDGLSPQVPAQASCPHWL